MNTEISIFFIILGVTIAFFLFGRTPYDVVALSALMILYYLGYISDDVVFSGFSSPTIIVFISTFFIAEALKKTGLATLLATKVAKIAGKKTRHNVLAIMLLAGFLSAFIANTATVTLLLPTVLGIASINKLPVSKLLIPLSFATVAGGTMTVLGTSGNIVMVDLQEQAGLRQFSFFEFAPFGLLFLAITIVYMVYRGHRFLPRLNILKSRNLHKELNQAYSLSDDLFMIEPGESLVGKRLEQAKLSEVFGFRVVNIFDSKNKTNIPNPRSRINADDRFLVIGSRRWAEGLFNFTANDLEEYPEYLKLNELNYQIFSFDDYEEYQKARKAEVFLPSAPRAKILFDDNYLAVKASRDLRDKKQAFYLMSVYDKNVLINDFANYQEIKLEDLGERNFFKIRISAESLLRGHRLSQILTVRALGFKILALERGSDMSLVNDDLEITEGDCLICLGDQKKVKELQQYRGLMLSDELCSVLPEDDQTIITELVLAPRSKFIDKTLTEIDFRAKYGFQVLAIWREGKSLNENLAKVELRFGDALLVQGAKKNLRLLHNDDDLLIIHDAPEAYRKDKSIFALLSLFLMVFLSSMQILPLPVAALTAAVLLLVTKVITVEEAYKSVSWALVFLIAALIPIGHAFQTSGAADLISTFLLGNLGSLPIWLILLFLGFLASVFSQSLDVVVAVILIGQIALSLATKMGVDPAPLLMMVSMGASLAFLTPFSHKAHLLVMGPGGYKNSDYFKAGLWITLVSLLALVGLIYLWY